jgi:hypothetical protein
MRDEHVADLGVTALTAAASFRLCEQVVPTVQMLARNRNRQQAESAGSHPIAHDKHSLRERL